MGIFEDILEYFATILGYRLGDKLGDLFLSSGSRRRGGSGASRGMKPPRL